MCNEVGAKSEMPKSVQVGPFTYTIDVSQEGIDKARIANNDMTMIGDIYYKRGAITLDPDVCLAHMRDNLIHEILHALFHATHLYEQNTESTVAPIATLLLDTLRRNPELVAYLTGGI